MTIRNYGKGVLDVSFDDSVTRIELEKIVPPAEEDVDDETYRRTIRIMTGSGEVLEVDCESYSREDLELVEVDQLGPVKQVRTRRQRDWLAPKRRKRKTS